MEIRDATEADIPEIVALLKLSLGESLMPKSEKFWRWKHLENPFGKSPVLLCWEGNEVVGVRAFMRWEWNRQGQVYNAVRAVDTATHPGFQGKGIFKKLTLALVDYCKQQGIHFVFNTPNQQSKPGYIKMGWEEAGKLPVKIGIQRPFSMLKNFIANAGTLITEGGNSMMKYYLDHPKLNALLMRHDGHMNDIKTKLSVPYLTWRYLDVPVAQYVAVGEESGNELTNLVIGRIKQTRFGRELRITDCISNGKGNDQQWLKKLTAQKKEWGIDYTTISGTHSGCSKKIVGDVNFELSIGPMVIVRSLAMGDLNMLKNFNRWTPALGDLELF